MTLPNGQFRLVFTARDYTASVAFYRDGLQLPIDHDWDYGPDDKGSVFHAGSGMVEIFAPASGAAVVKPQGISMSIQVDDADRWYQMALKHQLPILQEPVSYPWSHRMFKVSDPDGIVIGLFSVYAV
jgi:predicted enzyme related to lactoylglutathione lyase